MKTIILTFSATCAVIALAASVFLNSILGFFGLAAVSLEKFNELRTAQSVVEKMKGKHHERRANIGKSFAKRTGKRIATSATAAATIGTLAVTAAVVAIEVEDYCDEKKSLQDEANLLFGTENSFDTENCYEEAKKDVETLIRDIQASSSESMSNIMDSVKELPSSLLEKLKTSKESIFN